MRRALAVVGTLLMGGWALFTSHQVWAFPTLARQTKAACAACHANPAGGAELTEAGKAFKKNPKAAVPTEAKSNEYVGADRCTSCHYKQHKGWEATAHASAWKTLATADEKAVARMAGLLKIEVKGHASETDACVECHVTGFRLTGGYPAADSARNAGLQNVTCESCHGPGGRHVTARLAEKKKMINRGSENMCRSCHTPAISPKFDFEEYKKKGTHLVEEAKTSG